MQPENKMMIQGVDLRMSVFMTFDTSGVALTSGLEKSRPISAGTSFYSIKHTSLTWNQPLYSDLVSLHAPFLSKLFKSKSFYIVFDIFHVVNNNNELDELSGSFFYLRSCNLMLIR